jgi:uncharacterized phiE125 gp8 family phage protein
VSGSILVTGPAAEPVTLEEARSQCRLTDTSEDGLLAGYVLAARQLVEGRIGRALLTQTWLETFDEDWPRADGHRRVRYLRRSLSHRRIMLSITPVQSIASIQYVDTTGATQTLDPSQYRLGMHHLVSVLEEAYGVCWPAVRCQTDAIAVQYVAGYTQPGLIPETVRQAILLLTSHFFDNRGATVVSATRATAIELPIGVEALLAKPNVPWAF